jgi:hypothetical protein
MMEAGEIATIDGQTSGRAESEKTELAAERVANPRDAENLNGEKKANSSNA